MQLTGTTVLAFGTAGSQGAALPEAITRAGATPRRATTSAERAATWAAQGDDAVVADLTDPASVAAAASGAHAAALHVPLGVSPAGVQALVASVAALRERGLPVSVNTGTPVPPPGAPDPFGSRPVAEALLGAGATVLTPTGYLENHAAPWAVAQLGRGELVYPRPADDRVAWVTSRDLAAALVAALAVDVGGELLALGGPQALTFDELAAELGEGLGREVRFRRVSPQEYADLLRPVLGDAAAAGVAAAYGSMPEGPNPLMTPDSSAAWARLQVQPTPASVWAKEQLAPLLG